MGKVMAISNPQQYWEDRLGRSYDLNGVGYLNLGRSYNNWLYRVKRHVFDRTVRPYLPQSFFTALDIGSGTGFFIDRWQALKAEQIAGIDFTRIAIENLKRKFPSCQFYVADIGEALPRELESQQFDCVSVMDVLYHIVDDEKYELALRNIARLVKPGGLLVMSENLLSADVHRWSHMSNRAAPSVKGMLHLAGLTVVQERPLFTCLMNAPIDPSKKLANVWWRCFSKLISMSDYIGRMAGAVLYPIEIVCGDLLRHSGSTAFLVCRRK
jgi:ubiquinone/menaquinone biosynthesis C-methylase UbiE